MQQHAAAGITAAAFDVLLGRHAHLSGEEAGKLAGTEADLAGEVGFAEFVVEGEAVELRESLEDAFVAGAEAGGFEPAADEGVGVAADELKGGNFDVDEVWQGDIHGTEHAGVGIGAVRAHAREEAAGGGFELWNVARGHGEAEAFVEEGASVGPVGLEAGGQEFGARSEALFTQAGPRDEPVAGGSRNGFSITDDARLAAGDEPGGAVIERDDGGGHYRDAVGLGFGLGELALSVVRDGAFVDPEEVEAEGRPVLVMGDEIGSGGGRGGGLRVHVSPPLEGEIERQAMSGAHPIQRFCCHNLKIGNLVAYFMCNSAKPLVGA